MRAHLCSPAEDSHRRSPEEEGFRSNPDRVAEEIVATAGVAAGRILHSRPAEGTGSRWGVVGRPGVHTRWAED